MRRAKRVRADPAHERIILDDDGRHEPATRDRKVFVTTEAAEVDGTTVDEQVRGVDGNGAQAGGERHAIEGRSGVRELDDEVVEVRFAGRPEACSRNVELERRTPAAQLAFCGDFG